MVGRCEVNVIKIRKDDDSAERIREREDHFLSESGSRLVRYYDTKNHRIDQRISHRGARIKEQEKAKQMKIGLSAGECHCNAINHTGFATSLSVTPVRVPETQNRTL
jgi:hypothetical protein